MNRLSQITVYTIRADKYPLIHKKETTTHLGSYHSTNQEVYLVVSKNTEQQRSSMISSVLSLSQRSISCGFTGLVSVQRSRSTPGLHLCPDQIVFTNHQARLGQGSDTVPDEVRTVRVSYWTCRNARSLPSMPPWLAALRTNDSLGDRRLHTWSVDPT